MLSEPLADFCSVWSLIFVYTSGYRVHVLCVGRLIRISLGSVLVDKDYLIIKRYYHNDFNSYIIHLSIQSCPYVVETETVCSVTGF